MGQLRSLGVSVIPLVLSLLASAEGPGEPPPTQGQQHQEIQKLIKELGDKYFKVRERATKRLADIGVPDLEALYSAEQANDPETQRRATLLINGIRAAHCLPTKVNGLEFRLLVDKEWRIPEAGQETKIDFGLQITNTSKTVYDLHLLTFVKVVLRDAAGNTLPMKAGGGRSALLPTRFPPPLGINEAITLPFKGKLIHAKDGLSFAWTDQFNMGGRWSGLSKETYLLSLIYDNQQRASESREPPVWAGRAETLSETVVIK